MAGFELPERFWAKVRRGAPDECWIWTAFRNSEGYGQVMFMGVRQGAHRLSLSSTGIDVDGLVVRHRCDNPSCVNPAHMIAGTDADNMRDRDERGRGRWPGRKGSQNSAAKLTEEIVSRIKSAYLLLPRHPSGRIRPGELRGLAERFALPYGTLKNITDGYQWQHVTGGVS